MTRPAAAAHGDSDPRRLNLLSCNILAGGSMELSRVISRNASKEAYVGGPPPA